MSSIVLPEAFEKRMKSQLGSSYNLFVQSLSVPSPVSIRVNPRKAFQITSGEAVPWCTSGYYLSERPSFTLDPLFHAGTYYVQEASSMFLEQALQQHTDLTKPVRILDLCGAPGGKSTHTLSLLNRESLLVSNEVIRSRAAILAENITKWGHHQVVVTNNDPQHFGTLRGFFDVIILDAPCSGEGLFRKDPGAMQEWSEDLAALCAARQKRIVAEVWPCLKANGLLMYSTCTYNPEENEVNLEWLRQQHDVEFLSITTEPSWNIEEVQHNGVVGYHFYPHRVRGEGFFLACVRKLGNENTSEKKLKKTVLTKPNPKTVDRLLPWIKEPADKIILQWQDQLLMIPALQQDGVLQLVEYLHIVQTGTSLATIKHDKLVPEHACALSTELNPESFARYELTRDDALKYLRKEAIHLDHPTKEFVLLTHQHVPLGWVNALGNRTNNLYPASWRIRMAG